MTLIEILSALEEAQKDPNPPLTKQKTKFASLNVVVEYPKGSIRELKDDEGKVVFKKFMSYPYGYLANTKGRDTDEVDVILGTNQNCKQVFVAHMKDMGPDKDEREDEDKVMLGFTDYNSALIAFHSMYPGNFFGGMTALPMEDFRQKLATAQLPYREKKLHAKGS